MQGETGHVNTGRSVNIFASAEGRQRRLGFRDRRNASCDPSSLEFLTSLTHTATTAGYISG